MPPATARRLCLPTLIDPHGTVKVDEAAEALHMTKAQLADTAGLARKVLEKSGRRDSPKAQTRVREMLEIIALVQNGAGGPAQALAR